MSWYLLFKKNRYHNVMLFLIVIKNSKYIIVNVRKLFITYILMEEVKN